MSRIQIIVPVLGKRWNLFEFFGVFRDKCRRLRPFPRSSLLWTPRFFEFARVSRTEGLPKSELVTLDINEFIIVWKIENIKNLCHPCTLEWTNNERNAKQKHNKNHQWVLVLTQCYRMGPYARLPIRSRPDPIPISGIPIGIFLSGLGQDSGRQVEFSSESG